VNQKIYIWIVAFRVQMEKKHKTRGVSKQFLSLRKPARPFSKTGRVSFSDPRPGWWETCGLLIEDVSYRDKTTLHYINWSITAD
jgi:hypothetical protein